MSKLTENLSALAAETGLRYDALGNILYGQKDGFDLMIYAPSSNYPYTLTVHIAAKNAAGAALDKNAAKEFAKGVKIIRSCTQEGNNIVVSLANEPRQKKLRESLPEAIRQVTAFLKSKGFEPCCSLCGKQEEVSNVVAGGNYYHLCPECETMMRGNLATMTQQKNQKHENVIGGIVGAFLGSLLGVLSIIILSQAGYVAALSGVVMALGVLKGYEMLGGKLTKKGIVISVVVMLIMTYVGDRLDWAIALLGEGGGAEEGYNLFECYRMVPLLIELEMIDITTYAVNLLMIYAFLLLGAIPTIRSKVKEKKEKLEMRRLGTVSNSFDSFAS